MSSVMRVPETCLFDEQDLSADDARTTLRHYGSGQLVLNAFVRFRYGDGFTNARALGFQLVLALIPLAVALVGLRETLHTDKFGRALEGMLVRLTPGSSNQLVEQALDHSKAQAGHGGTVALVFGLVFALVSLTTAMGQIERGANRIYGIQRDRPALQKYSRAAMHALTAGVLMLVGFLLLVGGRAVGDSLAAVYGWQDFGRTVFDLLRYPLGGLLALAAFTLLLRRAPRRSQPGWSWLAIGAGVALFLWVVLTMGFALYVQTASGFGRTYGPLTGIIALLLWSYLTSIAFFLGVAFCAQLESVRAGVHQPAAADPELVRV
jgi:YihY family inner membrane protein